MKRVAVILFLSATALFPQSADWDALDKQVQELDRKGDLAEALKVAKQALDAAATPAQTGRSLDRLGSLYYNSGNLKDGETYLRKGLELRREKLGADSADYAESANDLALFLRDTRHLAEAQTLAEEAVTIRTRLLPANDLSLAEAIDTLGTVYTAQGQYEKSAATFEKARAIYLSRIDAQHPAPSEYGNLLVDLAGNYQRLGKYQQAERDFATALDVLRKTVGPTHPLYAVSLLGPAYLEMDMGNYEASEKYYDEAEPLLKASLGETHPIYLQMLNNRAVLHEAMGNRARAEADQRASLEVRKKVYGLDNPLVASTLWNYGRLIYNHNADEGEKMMRQAVEIFGKSDNRPAFEYAKALLGVGEAERKRADYPDAMKTFEKARDVASEGLGAKHPLYANALANLGLMHQAMHEPKEAEELLRQALDIVQESQGDSHPDAGRYMADLAALYDQQGNFAASLPLHRKSFEINDRVLSGILNVGSERTKAEALANLDDPLPALLAFQQLAGDKLPAARALAFEAVARRKGRVLDHVRDWRENLRETTTAEVRARLEEWQALVECESSLTIALAYRDLKSSIASTCAAANYGALLAGLRGNSTGALIDRAHAAVHDLNLRTDALEAELSREVPGFGQASARAGVEDIRAGLQPDELLVDIVGFETLGQKHYGAFLLQREGALRWLDLGRAQPINQAAGDLIAGANDWSVSLSRHETQAAAAAESTADDALHSLSKQLAPLVAQIASGTSVHRLRISPDGMLTLVPFAALSDSAGRPLIARFTISYLSAARDLVAPGNAAAAAGASVIALSPGSAARSSSPPLVAGVFRADGLEHLDGAEAEARSLRLILTRARLLGSGEATEQNIKALHSPAILHIIGHGLVRGNQETTAGLDAAASAMNLSAIVLEEAYGRGAKSSQDGLLTALELENLDLGGSQMLVLSQCRMADGVPSSGNGVYGMRRAAGIAGVKTFVAPLWNVSDSTESALMTRFYKELRLGRGRADALRSAMLEVIERPGEKSFLYWAPVILSGDPSPLPAGLFAR
jgi:CHAT domain-containing protein/tetratricopeptide (TPR) repeat protein